VDPTPQQLRQQAEHCRDLAQSLVDERVRLILTGMAADYDQQASDLEPGLIQPYQPPQPI
jgi:hypothetical protein